MYEGKITGFRDPDVPAAELGRLMAGGADAATEADEVPEVAPVPGAATMIGAAIVPDVAAEAESVRNDTAPSPGPSHGPSHGPTLPPDPSAAAPPEPGDAPDTTAPREEA
jgi:hypothetical protein